MKLSPLFILIVIVTFTSKANSEVLPIYKGDGKDAEGVYIDSDEYGYFLINNLWGIFNNPDKHNLVHKIDYISEIIYDPLKINENLKIRWEFPDDYLTTDANIVYGYPSISWQQPVPISGWDARPWSIKISEIHKLHDTFKYTIEDDDDNVSVLHDIWIYDENGVVNGEFAIFTKAATRTKFWGYEYFGKKDDSIIYEYEGPSSSGDIIISFNTTPNGEDGKNIQYYAAQDNGTIDIDAIFKFLNSKGHLPKSYSIQAVEFGVEVWKGKSEINIDIFSIDYQSKKDVTKKIFNTLKESNKKIIRTDGTRTEADILFGLTSDDGFSISNSFTTNDQIALATKIIVDDTDLGKKGEIYVVMRSIQNGKKVFSALNEYGIWEEWNASLKSIPFTQYIDKFDKENEIYIDSQKITEGDYAFYIGYSTLTEEGKPIINTQMSPFKITVSK